MFRSYSARVEIALVRSRRTCGYRTLWFHFGIERFLWAITTEFPNAFPDISSPDKFPPETPKKSKRRPESLLGGRTSLEQKSYHCAVIRNADAVR